LGSRDAQIRHAGLLAGDPVAYWARVAPGRLAAVDLASGERVSYAALDARVGQAAGRLVEQGARAGSGVALLGRNSLEAVVLGMACERAGLVFVPLNWRLTTAELGPILADAGPVLLIADAEFAAVARAAAAARFPVLVREGEDGFAGGARRASPVPAHAGEPGDPMALLYSSGTTGRPKGIVITRNNGLYSALNFALVGAVGADTVALLDLPIFHTIGLVAVTRTTLTMGGTLVISDRFDPARTLAAFGDPGIGVTHYFCVPQMAAALRRHPDFDAGRLNRLRAIFVGGAPVPEPLIADWLADGIPLVNGFGMTEAGTVMHMPLDPVAVRQNPGAIGLPAPFLEVRLVDADGREVDDEVAGELWLRGPSVTPGYKTPPAGESPFIDGWYRTGDLLVREANGFYRLVDRLKDIYISGGENVFPGEVEAVLLACPGVAEAAVFGVPDDRWGECGIAHVVAARGATLDPAALTAFCETRLARYKRPRQILVVAAIPRNASGKVLKHVLRRDHAAATLSSSERSA
jgi:fatty-acyl-CoA synthase